MKAVIEIIKRYLFEIVCGCAAAAGIALTLVGLGAMSKVETELQTVKGLQDRIRQMASSADPINKRAVDKQQQRINFIQNNYSQVLDFVRQANFAAPLTARAFPVAVGSGDKIAFRRAYQREVNDWLSILNACSLPTDGDIMRERDLMEAEKPTGQGLGADPTKQPDEPTTKNAFASNPAVRAAIRKAQKHYLYADAEVFNKTDISKPGGPMYWNRPPTQVEMWNAQLEIWVQRSIIDAIARINNSAAERLQADEIHPWIGNLPIKEMVSLQTTEYYMSREGTARSGEGGKGQGKRVYPPGKAAEVFTKNTSTDLYELLQFSVRIVVDSRAVPEILAGLCEDAFHTPLRVAYVAIPPDPTFENKIYGGAPVVELTIDFETVMFSEFYLPLMPDEILEKINKRRPEPEDARET